MLGLVAVHQPVALGAPCGGNGIEHPAQVQEHSVDEVGRRAPWVQASTWGTTILNWKSELFSFVVYLVASSVYDCAPVASTVICSASAWNKPVLSAFVMARLVLVWRGQTKLLWASAWALIHRQALRLHPAAIPSTLWGI